jgi:hypothetical protein
MRTFGIAVALAVGLLWATSGTQRERALLVPGAAPSLVQLRASEANAAAHPDDAEATRSLAQAYLDGEQPGFALGVIEAAPAPTRRDPRTRHLEARALLELGRNDGALAAESSVVAACAAPADSAACTPLLVVSAQRRVAILEEMLALGVEDTRAHPEASFVAYQNATREARVTAF